MGFTWDDRELRRGIDRLQRDLEQRFSAGLNVPLEGSEADAVESVKAQLAAMGVEANDEGVLEKVREVREAQRSQS